jgi:hypothetical protein
MKEKMVKAQLSSAQIKRTLTKKQPNNLIATTRLLAARDQGRNTEWRSKERDKKSKRQSTFKRSTSPARLLCTLGQQWEGAKNPTPTPFLEIRILEMRFLGEEQKKNLYISLVHGLSWKEAKLYRRTHFPSL